MGDINDNKTIPSDTQLSSGVCLDTYKSEEILNEFENDYADESNVRESSLESTSDVMQEHFLNIEKTTRKTVLAAIMVIVMGAVAAVIFLYTGITSERTSVKDLFERRASDAAKEITGAWDDYESVGSWIHSGKQIFDQSEGDARLSDSSSLYDL